jgi:hypothetical protein
MYDIPSREHVAAVAPSIQKAAPGWQTVAMQAPMKQCASSVEQSCPSSNDLPSSAQVTGVSPSHQVADGAQARPLQVPSSQYLSWPQISDGDQPLPSLAQASTCWSWHVVAPGEHMASTQ